VDHRLVVGELVEGHAVRAEVAHGHLNGVDPAEDVELGDDEASQAVEARGVLERHGVEPSAAAGAARGGPELAPGLT
jgi:hypothetical protein